MEIKLNLSIEENGKISLNSSQGKKCQINDMTIQAQDIFNLLDYKIGNTYALNPLDIDEEKNAKEVKVLKPLFDMLSNLVKQVNELQLIDNKTQEIKLDDNDSE